MVTELAPEIACNGKNVEDLMDNTVDVFLRQMHLSGPLIQVKPSCQGALQMELQTASSL